MRRPRGGTLLALAAVAAGAAYAVAPGGVWWSLALFNVPVTSAGAGRRRGPPQPEHAARRG